MNTSYFAKSAKHPNAVAICAKVPDHSEEIKVNWEGCNSTSSAYLYLLDKGLL